MSRSTRWAPTPPPRTRLGPRKCRRRCESAGLTQVARRPRRSRWRRPGRSGGRLEPRPDHRSGGLAQRGRSDPDDPRRRREPNASGGTTPAPRWLLRPSPGAVAGLRDALGSVGVVNIDGHMDLYDETTSPTGEIADVPIAALLGFGADALQPALALPESQSTVLNVEDVALVGYRDTDEAARYGSVMPADIATHRNVGRARRQGRCRRPWPSRCSTMSARRIGFTWTSTCLTNRCCPLPTT